MEISIKFTDEEMIRLYRVDRSVVTAMRWFSSNDLLQRIQNNTIYNLLTRTNSIYLSFLNSLYEVCISQENHRVELSLEEVYRHFKQAYCSKNEDLLKEVAVIQGNLKNCESLINFIKDASSKLRFNKVRQDYYYKKLTLMTESKDKRHLKLTLDVSADELPSILGQGYILKFCQSGLPITDNAILVEVIHLLYFFNTILNYNPGNTISLKEVMADANEVKSKFSKETLDLVPKCLQYLRILKKFCRSDIEYLDTHLLSAVKLGLSELTVELDEPIKPQVEESYKGRKEINLFKHYSYENFSFIDDTPEKIGEYVFEILKDWDVASNPDSNNISWFIASLVQIKPYNSLFYGRYSYNSLTVKLFRLLERSKIVYLSEVVTAVNNMHIYNIDDIEYFPNLSTLVKKYQPQ